MIERMILPGFNEPTTAVITEIIKGKENKCYILRTDEVGEEVKKEISFGEIALEVTKPEINKRLVVELNDVEFLTEGLKIIDTPGLSSKENIHVHITYGYLPMLDVIFMLMNIKSGTTPKSLLDFLKKIPKEQLMKMYFLLNYKDVIEEMQIENLKKSFEDGLSTVIDSPKVLIISAKEALKGKINNDPVLFEKSGVSRIEEIIKIDIVSYKKEIEDKKLIRKYKDVLIQINRLLKVK